MKLRSRMKLIQLKQLRLSMMMFSTLRHTIELQYTPKKSGGERCTNKTTGKTTTETNLHKDSAVKKDHRSFGVTRVRSASLDQNVGIADPESSDSATDFPCGLMPRDVVFSSTCRACDRCCFGRTVREEEPVTSGV